MGRKYFKYYRVESKYTNKYLIINSDECFENKEEEGDPLQTLWSGKVSRMKTENESRRIRSF